MNLARHSITATAPTHILDARFEPNSRIFTTCTPEGFAVYKTWPLTLLRKRDVSADAGTLAFVQPMHASSLLFLVGGGRAPLYPANKVILWDCVTEREVAELEFKERVCGLATRRNWLVVALKRRVVAFEVNTRVERRGEWETAENERGLMAIATAPDSTMLAIPGRQPGHVQLIHLPSCPHPPPPSPPPNTTPKPKAPQAPSGPDIPPPLATQPGAIIVAHESKLAALSLTASGRLLATASHRGTLVRVWDTRSRAMTRELRRGSDRADIYGVAFRGDEQEVCVWSDKGTVHVFKLAKQGEEVGAKNRTSKLSAIKDYLRLPKIFVSEWSYAQYRLPAQAPSSNLAALSSQVIDPTAERIDEERCTVAWIQVPVESPAPVSPSKTSRPLKSTPLISTKSAPNMPAGPEHPMNYQLVALTYSGGWYRLSLPPVAGTMLRSETRPSTPSAGRSSGSVLSSSPNNNSVSGAAVRGREDAEGTEAKEKQSRRCILEEFRRFGRWDGWA
ncbi:WD repeat domain phosphoinositide-interacting protein 3 OS=Xenopus tropicalis GN=wdr45b PE=2 SV=1 [Rhizoctonia solani AG-1 IB]|uniref:WD repeat domain phosphoinositide-interacting protein 3 n=1 Tax=Thanatephorus cucumeris (strain AG1-IB / isolate 7/3/14) TaxID=1108050 RepID=A0A0B7FU57_THACB|nr:WD repeat domain phosphoinositide-interacting protein 3 OS=Xenopus tropicalis GN=wdr45b PE=2 SV=1 [Rhizoctonia solani AG-1 IB]